VSGTVVELDFIKQVADAWDGRGNNVFTLAETRALWVMAYQDPAMLENLPRWSQLTGQQRQHLIGAAAKAISFGRVCQLLLQ
jgi:hypothetical protein